MKESRLQVRVASGLKTEVEKVARRRHTTVSAMVITFLQQAVEADKVERQRRPDGEVEQV
jgi:hypothetical protein